MAKKIEINEDLDKKVKVKMLVSMAGNEFSLVPEQEIEIEKYIADAWIEAKIAELIK